MSVESIIAKREQLIRELTEEEVRYDPTLPFLPIGYFKLIPSSVSVSELPDDLEFVNLYLSTGAEYYLYSVQKILLNPEEGVIGNVYARSIDIFTLTTFALLQSETQIFTVYPGTYTLAVPIIKSNLPADWTLTYLSDNTIRIDGSPMRF